jgi:hypothetical protein
MPEGMKLALAALFGLACNGYDCIIAEAPIIVSGSGSASAQGETFVMNTVLWAESSAPTVTQHVSFDVLFDGAASVECSRVPWAAVDRGVVIDISEMCIASDASGARAPLVGTRRCP